MNKIFRTILAVSLAVVCACSLIACTGATKDDGKKGLLCNKNQNGIYTIYKYVDEVDADGKKITTLNIGEKLTALGITADNVRIQTNAFNGNDTLETIIVPETVTKIEKGAFAGMKSLKSLSIPFVGMTSRSDVKVGDTSGEVNSEVADKKIEKSVDTERTIAHLFGEDEYDEGVQVTINYGMGTVSSSDGNSSSMSTTCYIPLTLTEINVTGNYNIPMCAFNGLSKAVKINLLGAVEQIGEYAFASVNKMTSVTIPASVKVINNGAFSNASKLATLTFAQDCLLETIGDNAFENTALAEISTPTSLKTIGNSAFKGCKSLTKVTLNQGLEKISHYAFMNCEKLDSTLVNVSGITLGNYVFDGCKK